jgi:hypothetical protein
MKRQRIHITAAELAARPTCPECRKPLAPDATFDHVRVELPGGFRTESVQIPGTIGWGYARNGIFCTLRCGFNYGMRAAREERERARLADAMRRARSDAPGRYCATCRASVAAGAVQCEACAHAVPLARASK